jgi:hypothetical protein
MAPKKTKKSTDIDDDSIIEVNLDMIDIDSISLDHLDIPKSKIASSPRKKKVSDDDFDTPVDIEDSTDIDFFADEDIDDEFVEMDENGEPVPSVIGVKPDGRKKKTLKKFIDVTVPAKYLEGLPEVVQLLIKK